MRIRALQTRADRLARLIAFLDRRHVLVHRQLPGQLLLEALGLPPPNGDQVLHWDTWRALRPLPLPALRAPLPPAAGGPRGAEAPPMEAPAKRPLARPVSDLPAVPVGELARPTRPSPSPESPLPAIGVAPSLLDQPAPESALEPARASRSEPTPLPDQMPAPLEEAALEEAALEVAEGKEPSPLPALVEEPRDRGVLAAAPPPTELPQPVAAPRLAAAAPDITEKRAPGEGAPVRREAVRPPHPPPAAEPRSQPAPPREATRAPVPPTVPSAPRAKPGLSPDAPLNQPEVAVTLESSSPPPGAVMVPEAGPALEEDRLVDRLVTSAAAPEGPLDTSVPAPDDRLVASAPGPEDRLVASAVPEEAIPQAEVTASAEPRPAVPDRGLRAVPPPAAIEAPSPPRTPPPPANVPVQEARLQAALSPPERASLETAGAVEPLAPVSSAAPAAPPPSEAPVAAVVPAAVPPTPAAPADRVHESPPTAPPPSLPAAEERAAAHRPIEVRQARQHPRAAAPVVPAARPAAGDPKRPATAPDAAADEAAASSESAPKTPLEWMAVLRGALSGEARSAPAAPRPAGPAPIPAGPPKRRAPPPAPEPLSQTSRRFLRPLVGFDPGDVRVHRGVGAAEITGAARADAVTAGEDILLAPGHAEHEPKTLGLLAHELTHVARQRVPRFVPPAAVPPPPGARASALPALPARVAGAATRPVLPTAMGAPPMAPEEEAIALQVEATARQAARRHAAAQGTGGPPPGAPPSPGSQPEPGTAESGSEQTKPLWGDLPAPWEPLPEVFTRAFEGSAASTPVGPTVSPWRPLPEGVEPPMAPPEPAPALQRAGGERSVPEAGGAKPDQGAPEHGAPAPDIDALARQVYDVLKRRLAGERRRGG